MNVGSNHFIGIGGIGMSALAKYFLANGAAVSGSDLVSSEITEELKALGAKIFIGKHKKTSMPAGISLVIHTPAAPENNPEIIEARRRKILVQSYPQALGDISKQYKTITVSGAHGKSTTTALSALVLEEGFYDPTVIVGTKVKEFGNSNFRAGRGPYLILEADEWNRSFHNYLPSIAIVTNIDAEHLDTYKTIEAVEEAFDKYLAKVPEGGIIIANRDDPRLAKIAKRFGTKVLWYSLDDPQANSVRRVLRVPGIHNVSNALAALTLGRTLGISESAILRALERFHGTWRRFEFKGFLNGASVFDDYGHHPREIAATIAAARKHFPMRRVWCVYQPHQYQRLQYLWDDFVSAFDMADRVCLLPVYDVAGRETKKAKAAVSSEKLARALLARNKNAAHFATHAETQKYLAARARPGDVVLVMGAGDIYTLSQSLFSLYN